ncbi:unnamed protein product, partial [Lymnaea stagnalis]
KLSRGPGVSKSRPSSDKPFRQPSSGQPKENATPAAGHGNDESPPSQFHSYQKQRRFSSPNKTASKKSSTVSRYSAGAKHSSTISVPSIGVQPDLTTQQSAGTPGRQNVTSLYIQSSPGQDARSGQFDPSSQRTLVTQSPGNDSQTGSQKPGNNVVTISVGGASARNGQILSIEALKKNATEKYG